jgi:dTDP-glucose 4,6-dehydratase
VTIADWVRLCYEAVGAPLETVNVAGHPQRSFFCFHDYDYFLDVTKQTALMPEMKSIEEGLKESYEWFCQHRGAVMRRSYMEYIDANILCPHECGEVHK